MHFSIGFHLLNKSKKGNKMVSEKKFSIFSFIIIGILTILCFLALWIHLSDISMQKQKLKGAIFTRKLKYFHQFFYFSEILSNNDDIFSQKKMPLIFFDGPNYLAFTPPERTASPTTETSAQPLSTAEEITSTESESTTTTPSTENSTVSVDTNVTSSDDVNQTTTTVKPVEIALYNYFLEHNDSFFGMVK